MIAFTRPVWLEGKCAVDGAFWMFRPCARDTLFKVRVDAIFENRQALRAYLRSNAIFITERSSIPSRTWAALNVPCGFLAKLPTSATLEKISPRHIEISKVAPVQSLSSLTRTGHTPQKSQFGTFARFMPCVHREHALQMRIQIRILVHALRARGTLFKGFCCCAASHTPSRAKVR